MPLSVVTAYQVVRAFLPFARSRVALLLALAPLLLRGGANLDGELQHALDSAAGLRVEMATDLILPILDSGRVSSEVATVYLGRLYSRADQARRRYPVIVAPRIELDHKAAVFPEYLSAVGVDRISIRLRVVKRLSHYDQKAARELLAGVVRDEFPSNIACGEAEVPFPGAHYYETLLREFPDDIDAFCSRLTTPQQGATLAEALQRLPRVPVRDGAPVADAIIRSLRSAQVSERVFSAVETRLRFGSNLQALVNNGIAPAGLGKALAQAWIEYVGRHARSPRCSDGRTGSGEDVVFQSVLPIVKALSDRFNLPVADIPPQVKQTGERARPPAISEAQAAAERLLALSVKLKNGGSPEAALRFSAELHKYVSSGITELSTPFETAARIGVIVEVVTKIEDDDVAGIAAEELLRVLEHPRLQESEPAAWIVCVRSVLNLCKHPKATMGHRILQRLQRSTNRNLRAYLEVEKAVGLISIYDSRPLTPEVLASF
ncbi:MAG: hypothetical protein ABSF62_06160 [Bryobacteraceae bacterium]